MASAPTPGGPGTTSDSEAVEAAQKILHMTIQGRTLSLAPENVPFHIKSRIRKGTGGLPLEAYWKGETALELDSLQVMWWAARMVNGELTVTIDQVLAEWPNPFSAKDYDIRVEGPGIEDDPDDVLDVNEVDNPESSGPAS